MTASYVSHSRHSVLVVDDDAQVRQTLHDILSRDGFDVLTAQDAAHALEVVEKSVPCMILLDVEMPGMNGFELCRRIKQVPRFAHVPVALVTARVEVADVKEGIAAGAADYIKKPFDKDEILMRVRTQIRLHEALIEQERIHKTLAFISSAAKDAIIIIDNEGKISHWNEAAERIFGYTRDEALRQDLHMLLAPHRFHEASGNAFARFQTSGEGPVLGQTLELAALRKSGQEFPIELSLASAKIDDEWCAVGTIRDITERKRAEEAIRLKNLVFDSAIAANSIADVEGVITEVNAAFLRSWGYPAKSEVIGKPISHFFCDPNEAVAVLEALSRTDRWEGDYSAKRSDGTAFVAHGLATTLRDVQGSIVGYQSAVLDVTERKQSEMQLARLHHQLQLVLDSTSEGILGLDLQGKHTFVNPAAATMLGYKAEELLGRPSHSLWHHTKADGSAFPGEQCEILDVIREGVVRRSQLDLLWRKDGTSFPAELASTPMVEAGVSIGAVVTFTDVTERKRAEEELRESKQLMDSVVENVPLVIFLKEAQDLRFVVFNRAGEDLLGYA